jgi:hypothetical protein
MDMISPAVKIQTVRGNLNARPRSLMMNPQPGDFNLMRLNGK